MRLLSLLFKQVIVVCLLSAVSLAIQAATFVGKVVGISDGDTIKVLTATRKNTK